MIARLLILVLLAAAPLPLAAQSGSHDDPFGPELNYFRRPKGDAVPLLFAGGATAEIRTVLIRTGHGTVSVDARAGVTAVDQNRVRLRGVPIVGDLFRERYSQYDLTRDKAVGAVYRSGDTLSVDIAPSEPDHPIVDVAILNQDFAYELRAGPRRASAAGAPIGRRVGTAYLKDGSKLVILVEPSVITHNVFDRLL